MFTYIKKKFKKPVAYHVLKDLDRIVCIDDSNIFKKEFFACIWSSEIKRITKVNYAFAFSLFCGLDRLMSNDKESVEPSILSQKSSIPTCLHVLIWLYVKSRGIEDISRPTIRGNSKTVVLGLRVLNQYTPDRMALERLYDEVYQDLDISGFNGDELKAFLSFLLAIKRYDDFIHYLEKYGEKDVVDLGYLKNAAHVYLYMGAYEKLEQLKNNARGLLKEKEYIEFIISLKAAALDKNDGHVLLKGLGNKLIPQSKVYDVINLLYKKGFSYSELEGFIPSDALTDYQQLRLHEMALEAQQEKMLAMCEINPVEIEVFREITKKLREGYKTRFINRSPDEVALYNGVCQLEEKTRKSFLHTESSFEECLALVSELQHRIKKREPTSFVRIGDGEALFIPTNECGFASGDRKSLERILTTWWGSEFKPTKEDYFSLSSIIEQSLKSADIIGVVPKWRIFDNQSYSAESAKEHRDAFLRMLDYFNGESSSFLSKTVLTSCHVHQSLIRWDLYRELFRDLESVSVISCHDLRESLLHQFGLKIRKQYTIPPEKAYSSRFNGELLSEPMYPDCMQRITGELNVEAGEVYLVAAGFIGKYFCYRIKEMGGIAIDIGSAADYFMGHQTRVFSHKEIEFEPREYLIPGSGIKSFPLIKSGRSDVQGYITTDFRTHRNINLHLNHQLAKRQPTSNPSSYKVQLIGHPRCASGYVAGILSNCGIRLGHEKFARDGICSWMHAVRDCHVPWGNAPYTDLKFEMMLAYARSPIKSIPSIAMENCKARSFSFRRYHIYDLEGVDIAEFGTSLERAIASYVYWYRIVLRNTLAGVIRVECLEEDLIGLLPRFKSIGFNLNESDVLNARKGHVRSNDSIHKFDFEKPIYSKDDWENVNAHLLDELEEVSRKLGYSKMEFD
ncbi:GT-D fold domain-containing protein [Zobellella denitrificans]|uniref:GT-D fold domain-containing protein n=1 Tax=Zobellella denitrificans TaxID=347534 RepID=UPI00115CC312|nr:hypothetical protein [Zobellella denitrificans]